MLTFRAVNKFNYIIKKKKNKKKTYIFQENIIKLLGPFKKKAINLSMCSMFYKRQPKALEVVNPVVFLSFLIFELIEKKLL